MTHTHLRKKRIGGVTLQEINRNVVFQKCFKWPLFGNHHTSAWALQEINRNVVFQNCFKWPLFGNHHKSAWEDSAMRQNLASWWITNLRSNYSRRNRQLTQKMSTFPSTSTEPCNIRLLDWHRTAPCFLYKKAKSDMINTKVI